MLKTDIFTIASLSVAHLKSDLALAPKEPKFKPSASPAALKNIRKLSDKYHRENAIFFKSLKKYGIIGYSKESGINTIASVIGREVEAESARGGIYIHKLVPTPLELMERLEIESKQEPIPTPDGN